jgi:hypothetical protein
MLVIFDKDGRPLQYMTTYGDETLAWAKSLADRQYLELPDGDLLTAWYLADGRLIRRPTMDLPRAASVAIGETVEITGLPSPSTIVIGGVSHGITTDGTLTIAGDVVASYEIVVQSWPYLDHTITVTVSPEAATSATETVAASTTEETTP